MNLTPEEARYIELRIPEKPKPKTNHMYVVVDHCEYKVSESRDFSDILLKDLPNSLRDLNKMVK